MRPEQHPASNSSARKAHAEATDPHEGCEVGKCKAERFGVANGWLFEYVNEHTCGTARGGHYGAHEPGCGMVPIAKVEDLLAAQPAAYRPRCGQCGPGYRIGDEGCRHTPQPTEGAAEVVCTNCEADDLGCTACGAHGTLAARSQRPEAVAVTEWRAALPGEERPGSTIRLSSPSDALEMARRWGATAQTRQRTTYPDVVTEWTEVSGDTEAGGGRG